MTTGRWHFAATVCKISVFVFLLTAASSEQLPQLSNVKLSDKLSQNANVSGVTAAGILTGRLDARIQPIDLYVWLPAHAKGHVCANIISKDGLYQATLSADIPSGASGPSILNTTSDYAAGLQQYRAGDLAVLAWISDLPCASEAPNGYLTVAWGLTSSPSPIYVLVNSEASSATTIAVKNQRTGVVKRFSCTSPEGIVLIGFNTVCKISDVHLLDMTSATIEIEDIDPRDPIDLPIRLTE